MLHPRPKKGSVPFLVLLLALAAPAQAHKANPNYLTRVDAAPTGVRVDVINRDDQLQLTNNADADVVIEGYNDDPYARVLADGTVEVNTRSPAYYLNDDRYGEAKIPDGIDGTGAPQWKVLDKTGRFQWHDHRMHWMAKKRPPQVKDPAKRTKIFTWKVPVTVGGKHSDIAGTLFWTPKPGTPIGFLIVGSLLLVAMCVGAVVVRRRRDREVGGDVTETEAW
jgi:hypothetical protein